MRTASFPPHAGRRSSQHVLTGSITAMLAAMLFAGSPHVAQAQTTGWNQAAGGTYDYNDPANWVDGNTNGLWDSSLTLLGSQTATFDKDTVLTTGLEFRYAGGFNVTLTGTGGARTLTLGGDILVDTESTTRTINFGSSTASQTLDVDLGGMTRTFTVGTGRSLGFVNVISNGGVIVQGGTINFSGTNTYSGATTVNRGNLSLNGSRGSAADSDITVNGGSGTPTLTFNSNSGSGITRAKSVTLNGSGSSNGVVLSVTGNASSNTADVIAGALSVPEGFAIISVAANSARNARLEGDSFVRGAGSSVLFRGTDLGVSSVSSATAGDANIVFLNAPALSGGSGSAGSTTVSIVKGALGEIATNGNGSTGGLVTYDSDNGVRLLDFTTEYKATITTGQTQLDNVRFVRASGDPVQDVNLTSAVTTINSLSFRITGAGTDSGVTISGDAGTTLKLSSGTIHASQSVTSATASDAMTINVPTLDLNGQEGVISVFTNGLNQANTPAPLQINSVIANDGGNGVTISGTGQVVFGGSEANTYTGVTTLNSGVLRLNKSVQNIGLTTDLVMNGGTLLKSSNAIADTANVTIHGGTFWMDTTASSGNNNHTETINNFTITGGGFGNHGSNAVFNINGDATISGSQLGMNAGGDLTVVGTTTLNGGLLIAREASSSTLANALTNLNDVVINNLPSGSYTAITLNSHASNQGALLTLNGDLTFTGNAANTNPVLITSSDTALANQGVIALNGVRTFDIGNGAAAVDLSIIPALVDGPGAGGVTKSGAGTLELAGANTFSEATNINAGTLLLSGSISGTSSVTVAAGATLATDSVASIGTTAGGDLSLSGTLAPGGLGTAGKLTLEIGTGGKLEFLGGSTLRFDLAADPLNADAISFATTDDWLAGGGTATLALGGVINYAAAYTIFENVSTAGFTFANITGFDTANYDAVFGKVGNAYQLSFVAIPEPGTGVMLLGGLGMLLGFRRSRRIAAR